MRLEGKVSIITGGAQGIGLATAEKFAAEGARVVICDVNQDVISGVVNEFKQSGIDVDGFKADVTNQADISNMVNLVI